MLYIRTDMNRIIATGHMMRCLSIADAAKMRGEDTTFLLADDQAADLLTKRGYRYKILHTKWNEMEAELPVLLQYIKEWSIRAILIDSYQVTQEYLKRLSEAVKTFYIDDLNAFVYPVSGLICYASYWEKFHYPARYKNTKLYLGLQYAPLRKEFCGCKKKLIKPLVKNLLLMSGGSDPYDILSKVLKKLEKSAFETIQVICGVYNTKYDALRKTYQSHKNICIQKATDHVDVCMKQADLAISAGGTTLYELCAVGTPTISYSFADNQLDNVKTFQRQGMIDYAGDARWDDVASRIVRLVEAQTVDAKMRAKRSENMQKLVDGKGAGRIAGQLMNCLMEDVEN